MSTLFHIRSLPPSTSSFQSRVWLRTWDKIELLFPYTLLHHSQNAEQGSKPPRYRLFLFPYLAVELSASIHTHMQYKKDTGY